MKAAAVWHLLLQTSKKLNRGKRQKMELLQQTQTQQKREQNKGIRTAVTLLQCKLTE